MRFTTRFSSWLDRIAVSRRTSFLVVFILSCVVRFSLLAAYREGNAGGEAENVGVSLARTGRFADPFAIPTGFTAHVPPFYPFLVSGIYKIFGTGASGEFSRCSLNILAHASLHSAMPILSAGLGVPPAAGLLAGLTMALLPLHKSAEVTRGWDEPYSALAFCGLLVWTLKLWAAGWPKRFPAVGYGLCWGLLFYAAPTAVVTYLGIAVVAWVTAKERWLVLRWWLVSVLATFAVLTPWTLRNHQRMGAWLFIRSNLGLELQQSYNDLAQATILLNNIFGSTSTHPSYSVAASRQVIAMGEVEFNRSLLRQTLSWIRTNPRRFLELTLAHIREFWFGWLERPRWLCPIFTGITLLAWAGLWRLYRGGATLPARVLAIAWATYPTVYYFFQYVNRYRVVIDWSITLMAAYWVYESLLTRQPEGQAKQ